MLVTRFSARAAACAALAIAIAAGVSCADKTPTAATPKASSDAASLGRGAEKQADTRAALLTNIPVTAPLPGGSTFSGLVTLTHMTLADRATHTFMVDGTISYVKDGETVSQAFTGLPMTLNRDDASATSIVRPAAMMATCDVLLLDLGPLHLDLLGLTVDLAEVILDINAVTGAGNLVGNLLCGLLGLLDVAGLLGAVGQLLDTINAILGGLGTAPGVGGAAWIPSLSPDAVSWYTSV
jgi:hypothetical protein